MSEELDPAEFVQRIRQLGEQRDQQDTERVRKLEEEIIQGRSERLARRAERARSLSPDKPTTPQQQRSAAATPRDTPRDGDRDGDRDTAQGKPPGTPTPPAPAPAPVMELPLPPPRDSGEPAHSAQQALEDVEPKKPAPSAAALGRSGTLSWQRRPQSGIGAGVGTARRPQSTVPTPSERASLASSLASPRDPSEPASPGPAPSRHQIAQSLGGKDPSWFKQTPERGIGSAALRRSQDDGAAQAGPPPVKRQLPGLSREHTPEPQPQPQPQPEPLSPRPDSRSRPSAALSNRVSVNVNASLSGADAAKGKSALPMLDSQKFTPPSPRERGASMIEARDHAASARALAMSPTQGRISPERSDRPASPTKGMGGFVQSAMLKRSDSVSKRWSSNTPPNLSRQNSTMSNRGSVVLSGLGHLSKPESRPSSLSRDNSTEPSSRPGSSYNNLVTKDDGENDTTPKAEIAKPAASQHSRSKSVASIFSEDGRPQDEPSPPSPSKRWSPTKSSWLESALKKPETPKPKQPPPQQPSWMAEINRKKQERGSVDLGKGIPPQSPIAGGTKSGRASPLKPVGLRKTNELPKNEETPEPAHGSVDLGKGMPPQSPIADGTKSGRASPLKPVGLRKTELPKNEETPEPAHGSVDLGKGMPPQSPIADGTKSGRASPLKPVGLRKTELPKNEETPEPPHPSPKTKPALSPKPSFATKGGFKPAEEPQKEPQKIEAVKEQPQKESMPEKEVIDTRKDLPAPTPSKPRFSAAQPAEAAVSSLPAAKSKPVTPPKKDLRAGLRSRQNTTESAGLRSRQNTAESAGLRPRQNTVEGAKTDQVPEFHNVFGRLKKAETKNYVAPDPLKDNILRGKSGLTITGGPKPNARRDELKESLISKKQAILAKAQETGSAALKKPDRSSQPVTTPEALARRNTLGQSDSNSRVPLPKEPEALATPEAIARRQSLRTSRPVFVEKQPMPQPSKETIKSIKLADRFNPALAGLLSRGPPPISTAPSASDDISDASTTRPAAVEKTGPAPELTHMTKGRARGPKRRAPAAKQAVAEMKETTPPSKVAAAAAETILSSSDVPHTDTVPAQVIVSQTPARKSPKAKPTTPVKSLELSRMVSKTPSPDLPRKLPEFDFEGKFSAEANEPLKEPAQRESIEPSRPSAPSPKTPSWRSSVNQSPKNSTTVQPLELSQPYAPSPKTSDWRSFASQSPKKATPTLDLSQASAPSPNTSDWRSYASQPLKTSSQTVNPEPTKASAPSPKTPTWRSSRPLPTPPMKVETPKDSPVLKEIAMPNREVSPAKEAHSPERSSFSVKNVTARWAHQSVSSSPSTTTTKAPIKLPTKAAERTAMKDAGLVHSDESLQAPQAKPQALKSRPVGLGLGGIGNFSAPAGARLRESSPVNQFSAKPLPPSPPASGDEPKSEPFRASSTPAKAEDLLAEFFDEIPVTTGEVPQHIDTVHILQNPPLNLGPGGKIRSLRKQIQEITGDGKLVPIPVQEEHVLFQDSMYLCTHVFGDNKGGKFTEVYLWSGNGVADATLEDVQLFARNTAKQNQGKLTIIRQGKETPNFFEALGGIVITRRGSRPGSKEYMLCGRRHLGHIAFDEVDFSLKGLCSGFAYIISTKSGKVFIWKGRGCSAEELSGARLIGMGLNLNGELVEVDEGSEPAELFNVFPPADMTTASPTKGKQPPIPRSAEHWRYKATSEKYRSRLFRIEQQPGASGWGQGLQSSGTPRSPPATMTNVVEIMPYCQRDLEPEHIYVLDAFFEMYIIVGSLSRSQAAAFSTALMFAQDYSILAVSEEDRPVKPITTIVLEGVPRDMKSVFRFWDDALIPAAGLMRGKLGRGKSLRILSLEKAIEATRV